MLTPCKSKRERKKFIGKCGDVFSRLTLTGLTYTKNIYGHWVRYVEAVCICGVVRDYVFHSLASGSIQSCGCLRKEVTGKRARKHSLSTHPLFTIWQNIRARCYNPNNGQYKDYGGRGIEMWLAWKDDFLEFYDWCMANGYNEELSLDRRDNDGFYAPYNCRFATRAEQNRNTRRNIMLTAFGETKCLQDWTKDERCKISARGLANRVKRGKWEGNFEGALTSPLTTPTERARSSKIIVGLTAFGETKCMAAWLEDERCNVRLDCLRERLKKGWDHEKAISFPPKGKA